MSTHAPVRMLAVGVMGALTLAAALNGCDDTGPTPPPCCSIIAEPESALVSEPLALSAGSVRLLSPNAGSATEGSTANVGAAERLVYVSLPSGSYPAGTTAFIRNTAGGLTFASIIVGKAHTCGLTTDHRVYCWGWNLLGQLGDGSATDRAVPVRVTGQP